MSIFVLLAIVIAAAGALYMAATRPCHGGHGHRHWRWRHHGHGHR
jgi:hypothetical protein